MALKLYWRCQGTSLDATHDFVAAGGSSTAARNSETTPATLDAAADLVGDSGNGILVPTANKYYYFSPTNISDGLTTEGALAYRIRVTADSASQAGFGIALRGTNAADYINTYTAGDFDTGNGVIRAEYRSSSDAGGRTLLPIVNGNNLSLNTIYGVVMRWDANADICRLEIYDSSSVLIESVDNTTAFSPLVNLTGSNGIRIGEWNGVTISGHIDNVFLADDYDEPLQNFLDIASYTEYTGGGSSIPAASYYNHSS